VGIFWDTI